MRETQRLLATAAAELLDELEALMAQERWVDLNYVSALAFECETAMDEIIRYTRDQIANQRLYENIEEN